MDSIKGKKLLTELFENPVRFYKNQYKGYELLNEYLKDFPVETLIPVLKSDNELIYRIGAFNCL